MQNAPIPLRKALRLRHGIHMRQPQQRPFHAQPKKGLLTSCTMHAYHASSGTDFSPRYNHLQIQQERIYFRAPRAQHLTERREGPAGKGGTYLFCRNCAKNICHAPLYLFYLPSHLYLDSRYIAHARKQQTCIIKIRIAYIGRSGGGLRRLAIFRFQFACISVLCHVLGEFGGGRPGNVFLAILSPLGIFCSQRWSFWD